MNMAEFSERLSRDDMPQVPDWQGSRLAAAAVKEMQGETQNARDKEKTRLTLSTPSTIKQALAFRAEQDKQSQEENQSFALPGKYEKLIAQSTISRQPAEVKAEKNLSIYKPVQMQLYFGVNHGHSVYSDGLSRPEELYQKAIDEGIQFLFITEHNHWKCRMGVEDEERKKAESQYKTVAENPQEYFDEMALAKKINAEHEGTFVAGVGVESGTIGKPGSNHQGGVNHFALYQSPKFIRADVDGPQRQADDEPQGTTTGELSVPDLPRSENVIDYPDGDTNNLVGQLKELGQDSTGGRFVIDLCHPRFTKDFLDSRNENPGRDYGIKSFASEDDWVKQFGKYVSMIEVIKGEALNPNSVSRMKPSDCDPKSFAGYIHMGIKAGPVVGRDFHFADPGGRPAYTGVLLTKLDMNSLLEGMRERRTMATTNWKELQAVVTADNDKYVMGSILTESQAQDLNLKVKIGGNIEPEAKYTVKLFADTTIGDGNLKEAVEQRPVKTIKLSGSDLDAQNDEVPIESQTISRLLENKQNEREKHNAAFWVEVDKSEPGEDSGQESRQESLPGKEKGLDGEASTTNQERLWTAPIFVDKVPEFSPEATMQGQTTVKNLYDLNTTLSKTKPYYRP